MWPTKGISTHATVSIFDYAEMKCGIDAGEYIDLTWASDDDEFTLSLDLESLRELVRQSVEALDAADQFAELENNGRLSCQFTISTNHPSVLTWPSSATESPSSVLDTDEEPEIPMEGGDAKAASHT